MGATAAASTSKIGSVAKDDSQDQSAAAAATAAASTSKIGLVIGLVPKDGFQPAVHHKKSYHKKSYNGHKQSTEHLEKKSSGPEEEPKDGSKDQSDSEPCSGSSLPADQLVVRIGQEEEESGGSFCCGYVEAKGKRVQ